MSWLDNKVVTCATNHVALNPVIAAQRWSKLAKKWVDVMSLMYQNLFEGYKKQMGWCWSALSICVHVYCSHWVVNASMTNAWKLFRIVQKQKIGMLDSQREVVMTILASFGRNKLAKSLAFPRHFASNLKLDTKNYILVKGTSKYCRSKHCDNWSIYLCQKCIYDRFKDYH